ARVIDCMETRNMTTFKTVGPYSSSPRTDPPILPGSWESHTARATTRWGRSGAVISVHGELDAANVGELAEHVQNCAKQCSWLVLDLHDLEFMGTAGFAVLQTIDSRCRSADIYWSMVPGDAMSRLLHLCDPQRALPTTESVAAALARVQNGRRAG